MEVEAAPVVLAVDDAVVGAVLGADGDGLAAEVEVLVPRSGVGAVGDQNYIVSRQGRVDGRLNRRVFIRHVQCPTKVQRHVDGPRGVGRLRVQDCKHAPVEATRQFADIYAEYDLVDITTGLPAGRINLQPGAIL